MGLLHQCETVTWSVGMLCATAQLTWIISHLTHLLAERWKRRRVSFSHIEIWWICRWATAKRGLQIHVIFVCVLFYSLQHPTSILVLSLHAPRHQPAWRLSLTDRINTPPAVPPSCRHCEARSGFCAPPFSRRSPTSVLCGGYSAAFRGGFKCRKLAACQLRSLTTVKFCWRIEAADPRCLCVTERAQMEGVGVRWRQSCVMWQCCRAAELIALTS